jgi:SAM-dependent methyltransferase
MTRTRFADHLDRRERRRPDPLVREHRRRLLAGLSGRVLELGCGDGRNFEHYPATVTEVVAVEPDEGARAIAEQRAADAPVRVQVVAGTIESLADGEATFDAVVLCWVLCTVPDVASTLSRVRRLLKPDGELRVYEHVRSPHALFFGVQRVADALGAQRLYGCETTRDTVAALEAAGFDTSGLGRLFHSSSLLTLPTAPHVLGTVRPRTA